MTPEELTKALNELRTIWVDDVQIRREQPQNEIIVAHVWIASFIPLDPIPKTYSQKFVCREQKPNGETTIFECWEGGRFVNGRFEAKMASAITSEWTVQ